MKAFLILFCLLGIPAAAFAQAAIAGSVRDPSGAPMEGVTVDASSPALIERARTAVTDGAGRYRIEDLRPGVYRIRFTHQGWSPYQHDGVELTGSFTATVDATLAIGPLHGDRHGQRCPAVDVQRLEARDDADGRASSGPCPPFAATTRCSC